MAQNDNTKSQTDNNDGATDTSFGMSPLEAGQRGRNQSGDHD